MEGIVYCDCVTCLVPEEARRLNKKRYDVLRIGFFTVKKLEQSGELGMVEDQRIYHQAKEALRKAMKKGDKSILHRF